MKNASLSRHRLRVISGSLKGRKLLSIPGRSIRPTTDRLRESLFNMLSDKIRGKAVLDLFAGTGALGIEAISRGADFAVFLDKSRQAVALIKKNIRLCGIEGKTEVIQWDVVRNLNCIQSIRYAYDIVFMDPPYHMNAVKPVLVNLHQSQCLQTGAWVVLEHSAGKPMTDNPAMFSLWDQRRYGKTLVSFLQYMV
jgi:16S rRNA (guanine966-N2)-methyltransferase